MQLFMLEHTALYYHFHPYSKKNCNWFHDYFLQEQCSSFLIIKQAWFAIETEHIKNQVPPHKAEVAVTNLRNENSPLKQQASMKEKIMLTDNQRRALVSKVITKVSELQQVANKDTINI